MNYFRLFFTITSFTLAACGTAWSQTGFPWQGETLKYNMSWQSGLSVGEASLSAEKSGDGWSFEAKVNAGVPGFFVNDTIRSSATQNLCSAVMERDFSHGSKKTRERTLFDQKGGTAERTTLVPDGGTVPGRSSFEIPGCARDALTFLYYARVELGQGRMVAPNSVFFGSAYNVKMEYTGPMDLMVNKKASVTDHLIVTVKGPKADFHFEVFYARDPARTPLQILVPLSMGTFTLDLVR
jgi:hypothetical protein